MKNIENYKQKIENSLKSFLDRKLKKDSVYSSKIKELIENVSEYSMRSAKRIRPIVAIFAYKCFKECKDEQKLIDASIALELIQTYLLIHDDIMDNSDLRRGKPTIHKIYEKIKDKTFGNSMAILAGDLASCYIYDSITESELADSQKLEAVKWCDWILDREIYGQTLDVYPGDYDEEEILKIYELKTATYTIQGPIYFGASLANGNEDKIVKLQEYAYNIGLAFQLQDDIIGIFGDIKETGKPNDSDIKEAKKTLVIAKTLQFCNQHDKKFILDKYGKNDVSIEDIEKIRKIIKDCGAYEFCINKLDELTLCGKNAISKLDIRDEGKNFLLEMADYIRSLVK